MSTMGHSAEASRPIWVRWRVPAAATITLALLTTAVVAGLVASPDGGAPVIFVNRFSSALGETVTRAGGALWWTYAFVLGVVAAFNPCGFALLPAYLGLYLGDQGGGSGALSRARRSLTVAAVVAVTFTALFGAMGAVFSLASSAIVRVLPWAGLAVGVVLVLVGGLMLAGRSLGGSLPTGWRTDSAGAPARAGPAATPRSGSPTASPPSDARFRCSWRSWGRPSPPEGGLRP